MGVREHAKRGKVGCKQASEVMELKKAVDQLHTAHVECIDRSGSRRVDAGTDKRWAR